MMRDFSNGMVAGGGLLLQPEQDEMTSMVDAAMVEMQNIHPPLRRSECQRLISAAVQCQEPIPARQEQEVVALRGNFDGNGYEYIDNGAGSDWRERHPDWEPLCTGYTVRTLPPKLSDDLMRSLTMTTGHVHPRSEARRIEEVVRRQLAEHFGISIKED